MSEQPIAAQTLAGAKLDGTLAPLNRSRLRAQLGMEDQVNAANIRRATALVLARIQDYYCVIQYTGPGYIYGRVDSEYPSALNAVAKHNYMDDTWSHREMTPDHPTCSTEEVFNEAGWMCVDTACKVACHEMASEVPEAREILRQARYAIRDMCQNRELSEVNWADSRRRLGTPGIRKVLKRLDAKLPLVRIGRGVTVPVVLSARMIGLAHSYKGISDWSIEDQPFARAC